MRYADEIIKRPNGAIRIGDLEYLPTKRATGALWKYYIRVYIQQFNITGTFHPLCELLNILEKEGDYQSASVGESTMSGKTAERLARVSLISHVTTVAQNMIEIHAQNTADRGYDLEYRAGIPRHIICGLAHDIGKLPRFNEYRGIEDRNRYQHADTSANALVEIFKKTSASVEWLEKTRILEAIRQHHGGRIEDEKMLNILRQANVRTRSRELEEDYNKTEEWGPYVYLPSSTWLDGHAANIINRMEKWVNVMDYSAKKAKGGKSKIHAFSWGDMVYVYPYSLYKAARKEYKNSQTVIDYLFECKDNYATWEATREIIKVLHDRKLLSPDYDLEKFPFGRPYVLRSSLDPHKTYTPQLVPIPVIHFKTQPEVLWRRRQGWIRTICWLKPRYKKEEDYWSSDG